MSGKHSCDERMGGKTIAREKREVEIKRRADTLPLTSPEVRPWPVTPPPPPEEVTKVYEKRKAGEFGKWCEDNLRFEKGFGKAEALQGFKVLDIGLWRMGHKFASSLLAEAGAEVSCIEPPGGGPLRLYGQSRGRVPADLPDQPEGRLLLGGCPRVVGLLQGQGLQARPVGARSLRPGHELLHP